MTGLNAAFPSGPIVTATGDLTPAWRGFFQALLARTGGSSGQSTAQVEAQITAEAATRAAADSSLATAISTERTAREVAVSNEATLRASADAQLLPIGGGTMFGPLLANGGFAVLGAAAVRTRPVVTGSRGANAALASLLTALASYGIVTDSSTI
jgi:hypothetical protein